MEATKKVSGKSAKKWLSENAIIVLMLAVSLIVGIIHPNFFALANIIMKLPFGIAQIGKAFRNEIVARQFIFRMREFEQMEMQFFVRPGEEMRWWAEWRDTRMKWHRALGFGADNYRFHDHDKLAHYANAATDIEYNFPFGFKEVEGIHSRTDFDLSNHQKFSGKKIQYFDSETGESYVPYVVETSIGVDRMFLQVMSAAYTEEKLENGEERVVLRIPAALAPTCGDGPADQYRTRNGMGDRPWVGADPYSGERE